MEIRPECRYTVYILRTSAASDGPKREDNIRTRHVNCTVRQVANRVDVRKRTDGA